MQAMIESKIRGAVTKAIVAISKFNSQNMAPPKTRHPYLTGVHTPMQTEVSIPNLTVTGIIPPELDGRYLRIGPNPVGPQNHGSYNWFLGDGMVHGVCLKDGEALWYKNKWVRTTAVSKLLNEPAAPGPRHAGSDAVNTNIVSHAGKTWALVEAGAFPVTMGEDLETLAHDPFGGTLSGGYTAHPHLDVDTGELHSVCYFAGEPEVVRHIVVDQHGKVIRNEAVGVKNCPSIHDCAITASSVIIFDLPVTLSIKTLIKGHGFPFRWDTSHPARIGVLPRNGPGSAVVWHDIDPCYVFHACNAFEDPDGTITIDAVTYDKLFDVNHYGPDNEATRFERWTIAPTSGSKVKRDVIDPTAQEFSRLDERLCGKPYRFAYAMPLADGGSDAFISKTHLIKHDLVAGTKQRHEFGLNRHPGEFVFVPRHAGAGEDEGWLLGFVLDVAARTSDLVILKADDFEAPPQATIHIPHLIPPGFHGNWIDAASQSEEAVQ
jgi:8'-apo-carotenoid 13,14-cleaving dioxygenase